MLQVSGVVVLGERCQLHVQSADVYKLSGKECCRQCMTNRHPGRGNKRRLGSKQRQIKCEFKAR